jgi:hypothetical protein
MSHNNFDLLVISTSLVLVQSGSGVDGLSLFAILCCIMSILLGKKDGNDSEEIICQFLGGTNLMSITSCSLNYERIYYLLLSVTTKVGFLLFDSGPESFAIAVVSSEYIQLVLL